MNHPVFCRKCFTNIFQRKLINELDVFSTVLWYLFPLLSSLFAQSSCDLGKCFGIQYTSLNVSKWKTNATFFLDGRFIAFEVKYLWIVLYIPPGWFNFSNLIVQNSDVFSNDHFTLIIWGIQVHFVTSWPIRFTAK